MTNGINYFTIPWFEITIASPVRHNFMSRVLYIDILRLLAMAGVIIQHCINENDTVLFSGHRGSWFLINALSIVSRISIPVFVMLSGSMLMKNDKNNSITTFYKKTISKLLPPLIIWSLVYTYYNNHAINIADVLEIAVRPAYYHLWFVYMLFGLYLSAPFLLKMLNNCSQTNISAFILIWFFFSSIAPLIEVSGSRFDLLQSGQFSTMIGWFVLGYYVTNYDMPFFQTTSVRLLALGYLVLFSILYFGSFLIFLNSGHRSAYFCQESPVAIVFTVYTFLLIKRIAAEYCTEKYQFRFNTSLIVYHTYLLHAFVLNKCKNIVDYDYAPWLNASILILLTLIFSSMLGFVSYYLMLRGRDLVLKMHPKLYPGRD